MGSGHDDVVVVAPVELGDHVGLRPVHHGDRRGHAGSGERRTVVEARADHGDGERRDDGARRRDGRDVGESPLRSGVLPWLKRITAAAPAAWAFATLRAKLQPPRWIRAIRPATKPAKSLGPPGSAVNGAPTAASV